MSRKLNFPALIVLILLSTGVGFGVHHLHQRQMLRSAGVIRTQIEEAERAGDFARAVANYERYFIFKPYDLDVLSRYGLLLEKHAQEVRLEEAHSKAVEVLERVARRRPDDANVRRKIVPLLMDLDQFTRAELHLKIILQIEPNDADSEELLGRCQESARQYDKAVDTYQKMVKRVPTRIETYPRLAGLLRSHKSNPQLADATIDAMVRISNQSPRAYLTRAAYRIDHRLPGAEGDVKRASELAPDDADVILAAAAVALSKNDRKAERSMLERGLEIHPLNDRMIIAVADMELRAGRFNTAISLLQGGVKERPDQPELRIALTQGLIQAGRFEEAQGEIARLRKDVRVASQPLDYFEARLLVGNKRWGEAARKLAGLRAALVDHPAIAKESEIYLAECHRMLGDVDRRYEACRRAVSLDPDWIGARFALASALEARGQIESAIEEYRKAIDLGSNLAAGEIARLLAVRARGKTDSPTTWEEVDRALETAEKASPGLLSVALQRTESLAARGRFEEARRVLLAASEKHPNEVEPWTALAFLADREGKPETIPSLLDEAEKRLGDRLALRLAKASYWSRKGGPEAAIILSKLEESLDRLTPEERRGLFDGLARARYRSGDPQAARRLWSRIAKEHPDDVASRLALFDLARQTGDTAGMSEAISEIRSIEDLKDTAEVEGTLWRLAEGRRLIKQARDVLDAKKNRDEVKSPLKAARDLLNVIASQRPSWSRVAAAEGEMHDLNGDTESAVQSYIRAVDLGDSEASIVRRAVELLYDRGRFEEADRIIRKFEVQASVSGDLRRYAAEISRLLGDSDRAGVLAEKAVSPDSMDYQDHLWLGRTLAVAKRPKEAEAALRRAVEISPKTPESWIALVDFLRRSNRVSEAEGLIEQAALKIPEDRRAISLARCYSAIDRKDEAERRLRMAAEKHPEDMAIRRELAALYLGIGQNALADPHLRALIDSTSEALPADVSWARRKLAIVLVSLGIDAYVDDALKLIDRNLRDGENSPEDLYVKAAVLSARPSSRPDAIRVLERLTAQNLARPEDRFLLAQLKEIEGDWARARILFQGLVSAPIASPLHLSHFIDSLLRREEAAEARLWLGKLETLEPNTFRTLRLRAKSLHALGSTGDAVELLRKTMGANPAMIPKIAPLFEEIKQFEPAEEAYRKLVSISNRPERVLVLAEYLGRRGRLKEALDLCDEAWKSCDPDAVAETSVAALSESTADPAQRDRVADRLEAALRNRPESIAILFSLGYARTLQGRYADATNLYRKVVQTAPNAGAPFNNLAWLLAFHEGKHAEALALVDQAIRRFGGTADLLDTRAVIRVAMNQGDAAIADLNRVIATDPKTPATTYFHLAQAHLALKNRNAATLAWRKARDLGLNPSNLHPLEQPAYQSLLGRLEPGQSTGKS